MSAHPTTKAETEAAEAVVSMNNGGSGSGLLNSKAFYPKHETERRQSIAKLLEASSLASKDLQGNTGKQDDDPKSQLPPPPSLAFQQGPAQQPLFYPPQQHQYYSPQQVKSNDIYMSTYGNAGDGTKVSGDKNFTKQPAPQPVRPYPTNAYNYYSQPGGYPNYYYNQYGGGMHPPQQPYGQWPQGPQVPQVFPQAPPPTSQQQNTPQGYYGNSPYMPDAHRFPQGTLPEPAKPVTDSMPALPTSQSEFKIIPAYNGDSAAGGTAAGKKRKAPASTTSNSGTDNTYVHGGAVMPIRDTAAGNAAKQSDARGTPNLSFAARKNLGTDKSPRPFRCTAEGCPWSFARQSDQRRHLRSHQQPLFHCPYWRSDPTCHRNGGSFNRQDVLKRHLRLVHFVQFKQSESGWCRVCQKMFPNPKHFVSHCEKCAEEQRPTKWRLSEDGQKGDAAESAGQNDLAESAHTPTAGSGAGGGAAGARSQEGLILNEYVPKPKVTRTRVRKQHDAEQAAREAEASAAAIASAGPQGSTSTLSAFTMKETMKSAAYRRRSLNTAESKEAGRAAKKAKDSEAAGGDEDEDEEEEYQTAEEEEGDNGAEDDDNVDDDDDDDNRPLLRANAEQELLLQHMQDEQEMDDVNVVTSNLVVNSGPGPLTQPIYRANRNVRKSVDDRPPQKRQRRDSGKADDTSHNDDALQNEDDDESEGGAGSETEAVQEQQQKQPKKRGRPPRKQAAAPTTASAASGKVTTSAAGAPPPTAASTGAGSMAKPQTRHQSKQQVSSGPAAKKGSSASSAGAAAATTGSGSGGAEREGGMGFRTRRGPGSRRQTLSNSIQAGHHLSK